MWIVLCYRISQAFTSSLFSSLVLVWFSKYVLLYIFIQIMIKKNNFWSYLFEILICIAILYVLLNQPVFVLIVCYI